MTGQIIQLKVYLYWQTYFMEVEMLKHMVPKTVKIYNENKHEFLNEWLESFKDVRIKMKILRYIDRLRLINHIHYKTISENLFELHIDYQQGYYIYFTILPDKTILILCGAEASRRNRGLTQAQNYLSSYLSNNEYQRFRDYEQLLMNNLMVDEVAALHLDIALEEFIQDRNKTVFLKALREVATLKGGLAQVSQKIKLRKQSVQQTLSPSFRPKLDIIGAIIHSLGFKISVEPIEADET